MNKITICLITVILLFVSLTGVYAVNEVGIFDVGYTEHAYKFSDDADIRLPFLRMSTDRMTIDRDVYKSGLSFARNNINVMNNLKGVQVLASSDVIRVNGNMEYGIIVAPTVIIEGTVEKTLLIIAENITIAEGAVVKEDIICSASKLEFLGLVKGNLLGSIRQVNISGIVEQGLRVNLDNINFSDDSRVEGDIYISSYNNIDISAKYPEATIKVLQQVSTARTIDIWNIVRISLIFALIYMIFASKTNIIKNSLNKVKKYRVSTVLVGLASILLIPLIIILIIILTVIGLGIITIPLAIIYASFMTVAFILSPLFVGSIMSEYIVNKYNEKVSGNWFKLVLTFFVFFVLNIIMNLPEIGYTMSVAMCILSTGILFTTIFRRIQE